MGAVIKTCRFTGLTPDGRSWPLRESVTYKAPKKERGERGEEDVEGAEKIYGFLRALRVFSSASSAFP
jgi:hypothetical protein